METGWFPPGLEGGVLNLGSETPWESLELVTDMGPHSPLMLALFTGRLCLCGQLGLYRARGQAPFSFCLRSEVPGPEDPAPHRGPVAERRHTCVPGQLWGMFVPQ